MNRTILLNFFTCIVFVTVLSEGVFSQTPTVSGDNILCPDGTGTLTTQTYDTYQWYRRLYSETVATPMPGETSQTLVMDYFNYAGSYLSVEVTSGSNTYISDEYFVDGYVFGGPYMISSGDFTIGGMGQAIICPDAIMYLEFGMPYNTNITWYKDGVAIPGANAQVLEITEGGLYYVTGAPAACPSYVTGPGIPLLVEELSFAPMTTQVTGHSQIGTSGEYLVCPGETVEIETFSPYTSNITWYLNGTDIPGETLPVLLPSTSGVYSVKASPAQCPSYTQTSIDFTIEFLSFDPIEYTVSGDYQNGTSGEYLLCPGDEMTIEILDPYTSNIEWYQDGNLITGASSMSLTVTTPGVYEVHATPDMCDFSGVISNIQVIDCGLGLGDEVIESQIVLFPNPTDGIITLNINQNMVGTEFIVYNLTGEIVYSGKISSTNLLLDFGFLTDGEYLIQVNGQDITRFNLISK